VKYEITVSYIGFVGVFILEADAVGDYTRFKLKPTGEQLKEIVIKHEFKPTSIKRYHDV
jgi:hypothetical protein